mmetsp:Transcript_106671/g.340411  ORF Transcript_106671/g.340411 Transcript_106671/m.340411 type:complete len:442 (-) Transcript_106671:363-1688(-)
MPGRVHIVVLHEVNRARVRIGLSIKLADLRDVAQRDSRADLQLQRGQVHLCQLLRHRMLDLKTGVQLQEEELVLGRIIEVLDGAGANVADILSQALGCALHLQERLLRHDGWWPLLEDFLEAALGGAIAAVECHGVSVLVADDLDLDVTGALAELHDKDGGAWRRLVLHLREVGVNLLSAGAHPDALAAAALGCLDHDRIADALGDRGGLGGRFHETLLEDLIRDGSFRGEVGSQPISGPRDRGHTRSLREDIRANLIAEDRHHRCRRANKGHTELLKFGRQRRVLRGVAPARPDSIDLLSPRCLADEVHVCVVVHILAGRNLNECICQADELCVRIQVISRRHHNKFEDIVQAQLKVGPLLHRYDRLGCRHAVVRDEDALQDLVAAQLLDILRELLDLLLLGRDSFLVEGGQSEAGGLHALPPLPPRCARCPGNRNCSDG